MSEHGPNRSFVLRAVHETVFEERAVPECELLLSEVSRVRF